MRTHGIVAERQNQVAFKEFVLREPGPGEILVKTRFSTVSPGTELRCLAGKEPNAGGFPMITGYSLSGDVIKGVGDIKEGDRVFLNGAPVMPEGITCAWGGHIGLAIAPAAQAVKLPATVDMRAASALAMLSIAMHGVARAAPLPGDRVLVAGQGLIGQLAAGIVRQSGCTIAVCDPVESRLEVARLAGIRHALKPGAGFAQECRRLFPDGVDILIDATGSAEVVLLNLPLLKDKTWSNLCEPSPKLVLLGAYGAEVRLDYQQTLFNKEADIITCRNFLPHDRDRAVRLLASGGFDVSPVLSQVVPPRDAAEAFRRLREEPDKQITVTFDWGE